MKRAVFLDRDGIINRKAEEGAYVTRWEDFEFLPGVAQAISLFNRAGWSVIVISNQRCVARGFLSIPELESIHNRMREELTSQGARLDGIYYCPHDKEPPCACRKPLPGMLLRAAQEHQIDLGASWMVGDAESDMAAGRRAGCHTLRIAETLPTDQTGANCFAKTLFDASGKILASER